jgi:hypothetical protein
MEVGTALSLTFSLCGEIKKIIDANLEIKSKVAQLSEHIDFLVHILQKRGNVFQGSPIQKATNELLEAIEKKLKKITAPKKGLMKLKKVLLAPSAIDELDSMVAQLKEKLIFLQAESQNQQTIDIKRSIIATESIIRNPKARQFWDNLIGNTFSTETPLFLGALRKECNELLSTISISKRDNLLQAVAKLVDEDEDGKVSIFEYDLFTKESTVLEVVNNLLREQSATSTISNKNLGEKASPTNVPLEKSPKLILIDDEKLYSMDINTREIIPIEIDTYSLDLSHFKSASKSQDHICVVTSLVSKIHLKSKQATIINAENWSNCKALVSHQNNLYPFCQNLYELSIENGVYKCLSPNWGETISAVVNEKKGTAFAVTPKLYMIHLNDGSFQCINHEDWSTCKGLIIDHNNSTEFLYAFCCALYEINTRSGEYRKVADGWGNTATVCPGEPGYAYAITRFESGTPKGRIWRTELRTGESELILEDPVLFYVQSILYDY